MNILVLTNLFPNKEEPSHGIFIKKRVEQYQIHGHNLTVFVPIPYTPILQRFLNTFYFKGLIYQDDIESIKVIYFKYFHLPKIGALLQPFSIFLSVYFTLNKYGGKNKFDLIEANYLYPDGVAAAIFAKLMKFPLILSARGSDINVFFSYKIPKLLILKALKNSNKIITVSQNLKIILVQNGIDDSKIHTIPNGVDHSIFYPIFNIFLKRNKKQHKIKRILMVGHLKEQKGQNLLIDTLRYMENLDLPYRIVAYFIGNGPLRNLIVKESKIKTYKHRFVLIGLRPNHELVKWYNRVDLLCLLSKSEGSPNVVLEAISCGLPILTTAVGDLKSIINKKIGLIIKDREIDTISNGLRYMLEKTWDRQYIANYSRRFDWHIVSQKTMQIMNSIIKE